MAACPAFLRDSLGVHGRIGRATPGLLVLLIVASVHLAALGVACLLDPPQHPTFAPPEIAVAVIFRPPAPPPAEAAPRILAAAKLPAPVETLTAVLAPLAPLRSPPAPRSEAPRPRPLSPRAVVRPPATISVPIGVASTEAPLPAGRTLAVVHPASSDVAQTLTGWEARIRQAVQDATIYPASARLLRREGRAQIRFDYRAGSVAAASIAQTSHFGILDQAALAAVTRASMPAPPAELGAQRRTVLVWVQFTLVSG